jgi:hypothetical protein
MTDELNEAPKIDGRSKEARAQRAPIRPRTDGPNAELAKRRAERRARGETDLSNEQRLTTAGAALDHNNYSYRWVNEEIGNVETLRSQEWEDVSDDEMNGLPRARLVGMSRDGKAMGARLMKKWKDWFDQDQDAKVSEHREREKALKRGAIQAPTETADDAGKSYTPKDGNNQDLTKITVATPTKSAGGYTP